MIIVLAYFLIPIIQPSVFKAQIRSHARIASLQGVVLNDASHVTSIVRRPPENPYGVYTIASGSNHGVHVDDVYTTTDNIFVGTVHKVFPTSAFGR